MSIAERLPFRAPPGIAAGWKAATIGAAVVAIPFLAYATLILNSFYIRGSSFLDAGLLAYLIHDGGIGLHNPPFAGGGSYWSNHFAPIFLLTGGLGHLLPLTRIQFFAAYMGVAGALPAAAVYWLLVSGYRLATLGGCLLAGLVSLAFAFNGVALAAARFPHFEMLLVGAAAVFLAALALRRLAIAAAFFVLCLLVREDAGFHLFALLSLAFLLEWWRGAARRELMPIAVFGAVAFLYSAGAVAAQFLSASHQTVLVGEYLGRPPLAGITAQIVAERLLGWIAYRRYVVLPALMALGWAVLRREPQIILGYGAFVPWAALQLLAARPLIATLPSYYAFPFMLALMWPLVGLLIGQRSSERTAAREPVIGFVLMVAVSFVPSPYLHNPTGIRLPADFLAPPSLARQQATDRALRRLAAAPDLGIAVVGRSILALIPDSYSPEHVLGSETQARPDTIIYFANGFRSGDARRAAVAAGLDRRYAVPGTAIRVASRRRLAGIAGLVARPAVH